MGKPLVQAAQSGSLLSVLLIVALCVIAMFIAFNWWRYREDRRRQEKQDDIMEKRLGNGSETMNNNRGRIERLEASMPNILTKEEFRVWCIEHDSTHKQVDKSLNDVSIQILELKQTLVEAVARVETRVAAISEQFYKYVVVPAGGATDKENRS